MNRSDVGMLVAVGIMLCGILLTVGALIATVYLVLHRLGVL